MKHYYLMPNEIHPSIQEINLHTLWAEGYRTLLSDLDNTLLPWNDVIVTLRLREWVQKAKRIGFQIVLFSNNSQERIEPVASALQLPFLPGARKPMASSVKKALALIGADAKRTVLIGDQLLTDIWAGKKNKVYTVLVSPISQQEFAGTKVNRKLERYLLARMGVDRI